MIPFLTPANRVRRIVVCGVLAVVTLILAANAHLVYVAVSSQPDCVSHLRDHGAPGTYRAAKSAC